jgi:hypothetical protein
MNTRRRWAALGACLGVCLGGCRAKSAPEPPPPEETRTPDRLTGNERLPEAETAFGLALPPGMHAVRLFKRAAYFSSDQPLESVFEHVKERVLARDVELLRDGVLFPRAFIVGDDTQRLVRIELGKTPGGTELHIEDITPPPPLTGLSEAEIWRKAGRNPDGTPIDQNQVY